MVNQTQTRKNNPKKVLLFSYFYYSLLSENYTIYSFPFIPILAFLICWRRLYYVCLSEGRSQRLKRAEANDRNQDKNAVAAENWYLLHNLGEQNGGPASSKTSVTLAVEQAAASERNDRTCNNKFKKYVSIKTTFKRKKKT